MKIIYLKLHVMGADSFYLVTKAIENGRIKHFHSLYKGPTGVLFDEVNHCIKPIKGNPSESTNLILVPKEAQCNCNERFRDTTARSLPRATLPRRHNRAAI
jgi:hypothetical protein